MPAKVPYVDLAGQHAPLKAELLKAMGRVITRGQFILGEEVGVFEERFAKLCGVRYALAVNSGTDALIMALRALGVGPGDEVITAPNSFVASASAIALLGARPVFADVREDYNLDPDLIEAAVTPRTKAILPVHLTGRLADMAAILEIARARGLAVVEDCAQAVCAQFKGRRAGSFGAVGCFSLHPLKTLNAIGDGGVLTTDSETLYTALKHMRNHGLPTRDDCVQWGYNSRLDTIQAAALLIKLKHLGAWTKKRRAHAAYYQKALAGIPNVKLPSDAPGETAVYHTFVIQAERRDELKSRLAQRGIETAIHYPVPIHLQKAAAGLGIKPGSYPVAEGQSKRILSLPVYPELKRSQLEAVARAVREFYG